MLGLFWPQLHFRNTCRYLCYGSEILLGIDKVANFTPEKILLRWYLVIKASLHMLVR